MGSKQPMVPFIPCVDHVSPRGPGEPLQGGTAPLPRRDRSVREAVVLYLSFCSLSLCCFFVGFGRICSSQFTDLLVDNDLIVEKVFDPILFVCACF